ncbi:MAG TPA: molybdopterin-dependent oxidoreductase, partial [Solirubrobacterales bacterium]|nr:molybdopterin-dependent oxidoreductase [Solirubrobacterales bacterium]
DNSGEGPGRTTPGSAGVAAVIGDASNEEGFLLQRLVREALGSPHVDSRPSRGPNAEALRRLNEPNISAKVRDIDEADAILVLGTDPLHSSPILDLRVRKAIRRNGAKLVVATERPTALDGGAEAVFRYAPHGATSFLMGLAGALRGGDSEAPESEVADVLRNAGSVVVLWGERIGREDNATVKALLDVAATLGLAGRDGSGLLEIPDTTNARGLREAGCLPDAGPGLSHTTAGMATEEIRQALIDGEISGLILFGADPLRDFPDTPAWEEALTAADFVVCFSMHENATTAKADVVLPLETHAEKDGTVTHPDGRLQRVRPSAGRPGDIRPNVLVLSQLAENLGLVTGIDSQPTAFKALTGAVSFYNGIEDSDIGGRGIRWQEAGGSVGTDSADAARRDAGSVSASDGGASGSVSGESAPTDLPDSASTSDPGSPDTQPDRASADPGSLVLSTYRDLWAGPITELNPPLKFLVPQQRVEISPSDAENRQLKSGDNVRVSQNGTAVEAQVHVKERVPAGVVFMAEGVLDSNANALLNGGPVSVEIEKLSEVRA